jgi:hypothetical protein
VGLHRGDRPGLEQIESLAINHPLDVLWAAQVRFQPGGKPVEPPGKALQARRAFVPAPRALQPECLWVGLAGYQLLAWTMDKIADHMHPVAADRIGREQHAGQVRWDQPLHDDGHIVSCVQALCLAVCLHPRALPRKPHGVNGFPDFFIRARTQDGLELAGK